MSFYPTDRIALFIDGANLYSAAKALDFDIDYKKLLDNLKLRKNRFRWKKQGKITALFCIANELKKT